MAAEIGTSGGFGWIGAIYQGALALGEHTKTPRRSPEEVRRINEDYARIGIGQDPLLPSMQTWIGALQQWGTEYSIPGTEPRLPPPVAAQPPPQSPVGFRTMGEASGAIIWESGVGLWGRLRSLAGIVGNLRLWGAVALADAIDKLFADATEGVIGQAEAERQADKLEERVRKEMREERRRQERRDDAARSERISAQREEIAIWSAHGAEIAAEQKRIEAENKALAKKEAQARERDYEDAVRQADEIAKRQNDRVVLIANALRGLLGVGVQFGIASVTKQRTKGASTNVNFPSYPGFPDPGSSEFLVPPGVALGLTADQAAMLGLGSSVAADAGTEVCYIRKPRPKRRRRTTRRICYERKIR